MATQYNIDRVTYGNNGWSNMLSDTIYSVILGASADTSLTVPVTGGMGVPGANINKYIARIRVLTATKTVWFAVGAAAAVPTGAGAFALTTSEILLPDNGYYVKAGDVLHFYSTAVADISVAFYTLQN